MFRYRVGSVHNFTSKSQSRPAAARQRAAGWEALSEQKGSAAQDVTLE